MRKTTFLLPLSFCISLLCLAVGAVLIPCTLHAQSPSKESPISSVATPSDTNKFMAQARDFNGLNASSLPPWHLKATFILFDVMGNAIDHGTYEEFWISPAKGKYIFTSTTFTATTYFGKHDKFTGPQDVPDLVALTRLGFVDPLPWVGGPFRFSPIASINKSESTRLSCIHVRLFSSYTVTSGSMIMYSTDAFQAPGFIEQLNSLTAPQLRLQDRSLTDTMMGYNLCFDADRPLLRLVSDAMGLQTIRNGVILFKGRYIPRDLLIGQYGKVELRAHLESIEELKTINEADFVAPHGATEKKYVGIEYLPEAKVRKLLIRSAEPQYPPAALAAHIYGSVHVRGVIGPDGRVRDLHVLDGPLPLQQAALDALGKYQFRPYYQENHPYQPFAVGTVFQIDFPEPAGKN